MIENDIRSLLESPTAGNGTPSLTTIEETLTTGYARAMALEAEQRRLQRSMTDVAMGLGSGASSETGTADLKAFAAKLRTLEAELATLRGLLVALRARAADARADAA